MYKTILHCDCNNFFASVEEMLNPTLKDIPMAVGGSEENRHGIILAKNEIAKKYGIVTAETIFQARQKCPSLTVVPPNHSEYLDISKKINKIYESYTDLVEPFSIDESFLDVTGSKRLFGDGKTIADALRKRIKEEIGITISVGVSFNKIFAKLGSDYKKPDATTVITPENFKDILYPLTADNLIFVGKSCYDALQKLGIYTIGDIAHADKNLLEQKLGKQGAMLYKYACGLDDEPVKSIYEKSEAKSIGNSITFARNIVTKEDIYTAIFSIARLVSRRLRKHCVCASTVQITIKYSDFKTITRQKTLLNPTDVTKELADTAFDLITKNAAKDRSIRMLSLQTSGFTSDMNSAQQMSLFKDKDEATEKYRRLDSALDKIDAKFGKDTVTTGNIMTSTIGLRHSGKGD